MSEQDKALACCIMQECFSKGNLGAIDELFAVDFVDHNAPRGIAPGAEGFKVKSPPQRSCRRQE